MTRAEYSEAARRESRTEFLADREASERAFERTVRGARVGARVAPGLPAVRLSTDVDGIAWDQLLYGAAVVLVPAGETIERPRTTRRRRSGPTPKNAESAAMRSSATPKSRAASGSRAPRRSRVRSATSTAASSTGTTGGSTRARPASSRARSTKGGGSATSRSRSAGSSAAAPRPTRLRSSRPPERACADVGCSDVFLELAPGGTLVSSSRSYSPVVGCERDGRVCAPLLEEPEPVTAREFDVEGFVAMEDVG